jgi:hypothetical protein
VSGATGELYQPEGDEIAGDVIAGGVLREGQGAKKPHRRRRHRRGTVIDSVVHNKWRGAVGSLCKYPEV